MGKLHRPRFGSLQYWPRTRSKKDIPSINWKSVDKVSVKNHLLGFICYKVGMRSILVKDNTNHSMTKGKNIVLPVTLVECPPMKVLSIRLYNKKRIVRDILAPNLEKDLKRKIKLPKKAQEEKEIKEFDNVSIVAYSLIKKTGIKKTPDICEIGLSGDAKGKLEFAKSLLGKELNFEEFFDKNQLLDVHGITKGHGFSGPVKRFGITLKSHKSEKGVRRPGSIGPWHPARVIFRVPMAGQLGYFSRVKYNQKLIELGKELKEEFLHYGFIKTSYGIIKGSIHGPAKRAIIVSAASRPKKDSEKENFEFIRIIK